MLYWHFLLIPVVSSHALHACQAMTAPAVVPTVEHFVLVELWLALLGLDAHVLDVLDRALVTLEFFRLDVLNTLVLLKVIFEVDILHIAEALIITSVGSDLGVLALLLLLSSFLDKLKLLNMVKLLSLLHQSLLLLFELDFVCLLDSSLFHVFNLGKLVFHGVDCSLNFTKTCIELHLV